MQIDHSKHFTQLMADLPRINWYPGHMHKAQKELRERSRDIHLAIEILDCRLPFSSSNPLLAQIFKDRPRLKLLNKSDLADPSITQQWQDHFRDNGDAVMLIAANKLAVKEQILEYLRGLQPADGSPLRSLIVGVPNVGKSTLLNRLAGRKVARTANEPAVTRSQQVIKICEAIRLIDSPGMLWPRLEHKHSGYRLACASAIKNTAFEYIDVALFLIANIESFYPGHIGRAFGLKAESSAKEPEVLLEELGAYWRLYSSAKNVDFERVARRVLLSFHGGELSGLTLERPDTVVSELSNDLDA